MAKVLRLVGGVPRHVDESATPPIYDNALLLVSGTPGAGEVQGPISAGTPITLPASATYNSSELMVFLNGQEMESTFDFTYVGTVPRTQISMTFDLVVGDRIDFKVYRVY